jgi:hypothetical protein
MALGWATDGDIEPFLKQDKLVSDHLTDYLDLIRAARSEEEKHAIIWCVSYLVPLRQFQSGEIPLVFYEDLCTQPESELARIFAAMHLEQRFLKAAQSSRPSQTTTAASAVVDGSDRIMQWQKKLRSAQITTILQVVKFFNLDYLYDDSPYPMKKTV